MSLFTIDTETLLPILDKDAEIYIIKEFNTILKRVSPSNGDADGRKKLLNLKELAYVWYMSDSNSAIIKQGTNDKEALIELRDKLSLDKTWTPDSAVKEAIDRYKEMSETLTIRIFKSLSRSFNNADKVINKLNDSLENAIDSCRIDYRNADDETIDRNKATLKDLIYLQKEVINLADEIPSKIKKLKEAELAIKEEKNNSELGRGKREINDSANPENDS